jgi:hypothetical protein
MEMIVNCDSCKIQMPCIAKVQDEALAITKSTYICDGCFARVEISRQGVRKEDVGVKREIHSGS